MVSKIVDPVMGEIKYMKHKDSEETVGWVDLTNQNMNIDEEFKSNFEIFLTVFFLESSNFFIELPPLLLVIFAQKNGPNRPIV